MAIPRERESDIEIARKDLARLCDDLQRRDVAIVIDEARAAIAAQREHGKGRHRAQPDMADGFAHACGRTNGAVLLYNGDDFSLTDMAR